LLKYIFFLNNKCYMAVSNLHIHGGNMTNRLMLIACTGLAVACTPVEKDSGDTAAAEPAAEPATEPAGEPAGEPAAEDAYQGPVPDGTMAGCWVVDPDGLGIVNAGLYCFENAEITEENCNLEATRYLEYSADGCPAEGIVSSCSAIPIEGDYVAESTGYWYGDAVGTEDACGDVNGSWEGATAVE
jgi:hypothetical protein